MFAIILWGIDDPIQPLLARRPRSIDWGAGFKRGDDPVTCEGKQTVSGDYTPYCYRYDGALAEWTAFQSVPTPRETPASLQVGGDWLMLGEGLGGRTDKKEVPGGQVGTSLL